LIFLDPWRGGIYWGMVGRVVSLIMDPPGENKKSQLTEFSVAGSSEDA